MQSQCSLRICAYCIFAALFISICPPAQAQPDGGTAAAKTLPAKPATGADKSTPDFSGTGHSGPGLAAADSVGHLQGDSPQPASEAKAIEDPLVARGRYLAVIAGCNDCHTAGFAPSGGSISEVEWLNGDSVGFRGPWGTTYPANLRVYLKDLSEEQWLTVARNLKSRPPMPSYVLNRMEDDDLRAIYRFIKSLGAAGSPAPVYVPPGTDPKTPYIVFDPVIPKTGAGRAAEAGR